MRNSIDEVVHTLNLFPGLTEKDLIEWTWGCKRGKKHADLIRRGLASGRIDRVKTRYNNRI